MSEAMSKTLPPLPATVLAHTLMGHSMWFECTPEPDDMWLFVTKGEADHSVLAYAKQLIQGFSK